MRREISRALTVPCLTLAAALATLSASPPAVAADPPEPPTAEGLWRGLLLIEPAVVEVEFGVELARAPDGRWTGTYDDPDRGLRHEVLDEVSVDDRRVELAYTFEIPGGDFVIPYRWTGELAEDGGSIAGEMVEGEAPPVPFVLHRLGPPGTEPPAPPAVPVVALSPEAAELREAFNRDRGRVRLLMLLSPKCSRCLSGAGIVGRRVLPRAADGELAVLVVWGPMFGEETLEDARGAAVRLPHDRAAHFWTGGQELALEAGRRLGLPEGRPAWDTYLLFPPGITWEAELPPPAAHFLPGGRNVPEDRRFHGERLAAEVLRLAAAGPAAGAARGASRRPE
jgi:hypothetical protein